MNDSDYDKPNSDGSQSETDSFSCCNVSQDLSDDASTPQNCLNREIAKQLIHWRREETKCYTDKTRIFANRFQLLEELGTGGFGVVYRALDLAHSTDDSPRGKEIALKIPRFLFDDELQQTALQFSDSKYVTLCFFRNEVLVQQQLQNVPNIVRIDEASIPKDDSKTGFVEFLKNQPFWFSMKLYSSNLRRFIDEQENQIPQNLSVNILSNIARPLAVMHKPGSEKIHRDLKPENILLIVIEGRVMEVALADFGLVIPRKRQERSGNRPTGTRSYLAPEVWSGGMATQRSDIYSWGLIAYQILFGEFPEFDQYGHPIVALSNRPDLPDYLSRLVMKCLEADPNKRHGSFSDILKSIDSGEHPPDRPIFTQIFHTPSTVLAQDLRAEDLNFSSRWLKFKKNEEHWNQLADFLNADQKFLWWGVVAEGGIGKSRLAMEFCEHATNIGWDAGMLAPSKAINWLESSRVDLNRNTLVVVDYAFNKLKSFLTFIEGYNLSRLDRGENPKLRILFLDRPGRLTAKGMEFDSVDHGHQSNVRLARQYLFNRDCSVIKKHPCPIEPLASEHELLTLKPLPREYWREWLVGMLPSEFEDRIPPSQQIEWWNKVGRLTEGRILFIQMLAANIARDPNCLDGSKDSNLDLQVLLQSMLQNEKDKYWEPVARSANLNSINDLELIQQGIGLVTLNRGLASREQQLLFSTIDGFKIEHFRCLEKILARDRNPIDENPRLMPLEPDLLGEYLILELVTSDFLGHTQSSLPIDPDRWVLNGCAKESNVFEMITLLIEDFPKHPAIPSWLRALSVLVPSSSDPSRSSRITSSINTWLTNNQTSTSDILDVLLSHTSNLIGVDNCEENRSLTREQTLIAVQDACNSIFLSAEKSAFDEGKHWLARLYVLCSMPHWRDDYDIQCSLVHGLTRAITKFGLRKLGKEWANRFWEVMSRPPMKSNEAMLSVSFDQFATNVVESLSEPTFGKSDETHHLFLHNIELLSREPIWLHSRRLRYSVTNLVTKAISAMGLTGRFDLMLKWQTLLLKLFPLPSCSDEEEIAELIADSALNAHCSLRMKNKFSEESPAILRALNLKDQYQGNKVIKRCFSMVAADMVSILGPEHQEHVFETLHLVEFYADEPGIERWYMSFHQILSSSPRVDKLELMIEWAESLAELSTLPLWQDDELIQRCHACSVQRTALALGLSGKLTEMEDWHSRLFSIKTKGIASEPSDDITARILGLALQETELTLAMSSVSLIVAYGKVGNIAECKSQLEWLRSFSRAAKLRAPVYIKYWFACGLTAAIIAYRQASLFDEMEACVKELEELAKAEPKSIYVLEQFCSGALLAASSFAVIGEFSKMQNWTKRLAEASIADGRGQLRLYLLDSIAIEIDAYDSRNMFEELERVGYCHCDTIEMDAWHNASSSRYSLSLLRVLSNYFGQSKIQPAVVNRWIDRFFSFVNLEVFRSGRQSLLTRGCSEILRGFAIHGEQYWLIYWTKFISQLPDIKDRIESETYGLHLSLGWLSAIACLERKRMDRHVLRFGRTIFDIIGNQFDCNKLVYRQSDATALNLERAVQSNLSEIAVIVLVCSKTWHQKTWRSKLIRCLTISKMEQTRFGQLIELVISFLNLPYRRKKATAVLVELARFRPSAVIDDKSPNTTLASFVSTLPSLNEKWRKEMIELAKKAGGEAGNRDTSCE